MPSESYLRSTKSETRNMAEHAVRTKRKETVEEEGRMTNRSFFAAFVVIAALLTVLALLLR